MHCHRVLATLITLLPKCGDSPKDCTIIETIEVYLMIVSGNSGLNRPTRNPTLPYDDGRLSSPTQRKEKFVNYPYTVTTLWYNY